MINKVDNSARVRNTGRLAVIGSGCIAFGILLFDFQSGGHGEMGSFYHRNLIWVLCFAGCGVATGIGLLRAWPWARISMLILSGLLVASGTLAVVGFLRMPAGNVSGAMLVMSWVSLIVVPLIPIVIGVRWLVFFSRKEVRAHFRAGHAD